MASTADQAVPERRSFYVACSRVSEQLHISAPAINKVESVKPSRLCWESGVVPVRIAGLSGQRQTMVSLIAEPRRVVADPAEFPAMRRAVALRLVHLADITNQQYRPASREARPEN